MATVSDSQEIEVEVVEVVDKPTSSHPERPAQSSKQPASDGTQRPFGRGIPIRSLKIPVWMWPLAILFGILLFLLAVVIGLVIVLPFLLIRAIVRLLLGPAPRH